MLNFLRRLRAILASLRHPNRTTVVEHDGRALRECPGQDRERFRFVCIHEGHCNATGRCQTLGLPMPEGR